MLNRENRIFGAPHAFDGFVVEVDMGHFDKIRKRFVIGRETVILSSDRDLAGAEIFDWMITAAVTKFELVGSAPKAVGQDLVAEADPEDGDLPNQLSDLFMNISEGSRVSGAV